MDGNQVCYPTLHEIGAACKTHWIMEINGTICRILPQEEVTFGDATKK